jgi:hypothetical protein
LHLQKKDVPERTQLSRHDPQQQHERSSSLDLEAAVAANLGDIGNKYERSQGRDSLNRSVYLSELFSLVFIQITL